MSDKETHPLQPFLPEGARLLLLGSFPPPRRRWSMEFYYPNLQNDMWRIVGFLFFGERDYFLASGRRAFDQPRIEAFCRERGIALYDTAEEVIRLNDNASDATLEVLRETDIPSLLLRLPACRTIAVTGGKAAETAARTLCCAVPAVGERTETTFGDRMLTIWRMPSTSRAFPRSLEWKAAYYRKVFSGAGLL